MTLLFYLEKLNSSNGLVYILIRAVLVYIYAIFLLRFGKVRFQLYTPFDFVLIIILGAILGRTIYGGVSLIDTFIASFILILLHSLFALLALKHRPYGRLFKGEAIYLIKDNKIVSKNMRLHRITMEDLKEECRL